MDMPFSSIGAGDGKSSLRRQDLREVFSKITDAAKKEKADLLLISGDLYEHRYVKKSTINYINELFNGIPDVRVLILPGNHDPYTIDSYYRNYNWSGNVHILCKDRPHVFLEDINTCIYGAGLGEVYVESRPLHHIRLKDPQLVNILMLHGTLDMNFGKNVYNPVSSEDLESLCMDYIALGHFHTRILGAGSAGRIFNPGSPEPLGFDEPGEHGLIAGCISKADGKESIVETRFINSNIKYCGTVELNISDLSSNREVIERIENTISSNDMSNGLFSITLKGYIEPDFEIDTVQICNAFREKTFYFKVKDETAPAYDIFEIAKEPGLKGLFAAKILARIEKAGDESERKLIMKAFHYGIEALEYGKLDIGG